METETLLFIAIRLGYVSNPELAPTLALITEISKMLTALHTHLRARSAR